MNFFIRAFFSFRFPEIFAYAEDVEVMQEELNDLIEGGVQKITTLVRNAEMWQTMDIESGKNVCTHSFDVFLAAPSVTKPDTERQNAAKYSCFNLNSMALFYEPICCLSFFRIDRLGRWSFW